MTASRARFAKKRHRTRALILRRVGIGEADLVVTLFTEDLGQLSALARGARRSQRRFGGALEPFHTLRLCLDERVDKELMTLTEASLDVVRHHLVADLDRMNAAAQALAWVQSAAPPRTVERAVWLELSTLLEHLDAPDCGYEVPTLLATGGLRLLQAFGWGMDLTRCVRCGRECAPHRSAMLDAAAGGLVCSACGGARLRVPGASRMRLLEAMKGGHGKLERSDATLALDLVERALAAHGHTRSVKLP